VPILAAMTERPETGGPPMSAPSAPDAKTRRNALIQGGVAIVIVVIVFGVVLPQVIDYQQVWETIRSLEWWQILVLIIAGLITYLPEGGLYALLVPVLRYRQGVAAWIASTAVASTIPAVDLVVRFGMYRSWGATVESSTLGILLSGVFDNIVKFSLPVIAILAIATGGVGDFEGGLVLVAFIALIVLIGTVVVVVGVVRSERFTRRLANGLQSVANWVLTRIKRDPLSGLEAKVVSFRDNAVDLVRSVWIRAAFASALGKLWTFVILLLALRFVGLDEQAISTRDAFIVWAIVLLLGSIPLTPGGVGFVELGFVLLFTQIAGDQYTNTIGAAVALYRLIQWAMPIPIGWGIVFWWRRAIKSGRLPDPFALQGGRTEGTSESG
jgi:uncharacterized protein (TIRG00374 family)